MVYKGGILIDVSKGGLGDSHLYTYQMYTPSQIPFFNHNYRMIITLRLLIEFITLMFDSTIYVQQRRKCSFSVLMNMVGTYVHYLLYSCMLIIIL